MKSFVTFANTESKVSMGSVSARYAETLHVRCCSQESIELAAEEFG
jgi:hypothetical protein